MITSQQWMNWHANSIGCQDVTVNDFSVDPLKWIEGDSFTQKRQLPPAFGNQTFSKTNKMAPVSNVSANTAIHDRMNHVRKDRLEVRQRVSDNWVPPKFLPVDGLPEVSKRENPVRVDIRPQQHSFLRSVAWILDGHFRMETDKTWNFSRIEWLRQISEDSEPYGIALQQTILRTSLDWDELCKSTLTGNNSGEAPLVVKALMNWTRCQFLIWNSDENQWHRWCETDWAAPIIFMNWNGERFSPITWLKGISATEDTFRPFPSIWVTPWLKTWGFHPVVDVNPPIFTPKLEPEPESEIELESDKEEEGGECVEPEPEPEHFPMRQVSVRGWKKTEWQKFADESGVSTSKQSEKTGKTIQKTIEELRVELETIGYTFM